MKTCGKSIRKPGQRDFSVCGYGYQCIQCQLSDFTGESQKEAEVKNAIAFVRHYSGCKYPVIKVNSLEVVIAGDREDADELAELINSMSSATVQPVADPNEVEVDQILARLESYYKGDERLARGAKHLSVNTEDLRTLTDYIKFMRGQLRAANRRG